MSRNILLLTSSPRGEFSFSSQVAKELAQALTEAEPGAKVVTRDLARDQLPHIGEDYVVGRALPPEKRNATQSVAVALSDKLIAEAHAADTIIIASGLINFGLPTTLKAWFDYVMRAGSTFRYTEKGSEGLLKGKKAYLVHARGGVYSQGPMKQFDFQDPYLKVLLGFMGITDVEVINVEGVAMGPDIAKKAVADALAHVQTIVPAPVAN